MHGRLHLRVRAREIRVEAHIESRVEIDRAWVIAQQAVEVGAARGGAGRWWLECALREVVRGEVEGLEGEHGCRRSRALIDGGALRRSGGPAGVRGGVPHAGGMGRVLDGARRGYGEDPARPPYV